MVRAMRCWGTNSQVELQRVKWPQVGAIWVVEFTNEAVGVCRDVMPDGVPDGVLDSIARGTSASMPIESIARSRTGVVVATGAFVATGVFVATGLRDRCPMANPLAAGWANAGASLGSSCAM